MSEMLNAVNISHLRDFIRLPDCVIFIGSGISTWSGLPSWSKLIDELATHLEAEGQSATLVRREIANGDLMQAASYGVSRLTPTSFGSFIRKSLRIGAASPHAIHKAVVELGPTSFITTNYDTLIEQALRTWRSETFFPAAVTNRHLVELAEIVSARSSHFIFKPHGDVSDLQSIILTREHYRLLFAGGERHGSLDVLKTLLVTRPILYLGFGLRDPDFIHLRDLLLNIYQGAVRDHWAIMPNVSLEETEYWRGQYGIKLHGYATHRSSDPSKEHRELLELLQSLASLEKSQTVSTSSNLQVAAAREAERVLALTRYASGLTRRFAITATPIEVRISRLNSPQTSNLRFDQFEGWTTARFLFEGPKTAYLVGLPGAGKSFSLRLACCQLAERLQSACLTDQLASENLVVPVFIDLKLFHGDLREQIVSDLPAGFTLSELCGKLRLKLFLDAFNEMRSEYIELGTVFDSLDALETEIGPFDVVIASRTSDGFVTRHSENALYEIDRFDEEHVISVLASQGISLRGAFAADILSLLSRPFLLQLVAKKLVDLPTDAKPRDLYESYTVKLLVQCTERFGDLIELLPIFSKVAYRAIENDSEAFPVAWLTDLIKEHPSKKASTSASEVVNWLIGRQVITAFTGRRVSFVHQSVTEYYASIELSRRLHMELITIHEIIQSKKWDQCLLQALSLLELEVSRDILRKIISADLRLAINAVRYADEGQSEAVSIILTSINEEINKGRFARLWISLRKLPVGPEHLSLLYQILEKRDTLGGDVLQLIARLKGIAFKPELLDLLEMYSDDYNFSVNGIAVALTPMLTEADLSRLLHIATIWQTKGDKDCCSAVGDLLGNYESTSLVRAIGVSIKDASPQMASLLADALHRRDDNQSCLIQAELLLHHPRETTSSFALALISRKSDADGYPGCKMMTIDHVEAIWSSRFHQELWQSALSSICAVRPDLAAHVIQMARSYSGIEALALRYCGGAEGREVLSEVALLLAHDDEFLRTEPFTIFSLRSLDWRESEELLARSICRDLPDLRKALLSDDFRSSAMRRGVLDFKTLWPVVQIVRFLRKDAEGWWQRQKLGEVVAYLGDSEVQKRCFDSLVNGPDWLQNWVKAHYLHEVEGLTTDRLDENMVAALLSDLNFSQKVVEFWYNPLGQIATDRFIIERLLPLAEGASVSLLDNLSIVLKTAGDRHGRRYLITR